MQPLGSAMIGMGRTVVGEKMKSWESPRILQTETGIEYIAKTTENKEETTFKLTKLAATEVVFENPDHDFPQRIIYRLLNATHYPLASKEPATANYAVWISP